MWIIDFFVVCIGNEWGLEGIGYHVVGDYIIIDDAVCFDSAVEWMREWEWWWEWGWGWASQGESG